MSVTNHSLNAIGRAGKELCCKPSKLETKKQNLPNDAPLWIFFSLGERISQVEETIGGHNLPCNGGAKQGGRASHEDTTWRQVPDGRISAQFEQTTVICISTVKCVQNAGKILVKRNEAVGGNNMNVKTIHAFKGNGWNKFIAVGKDLSARTPLTGMTLKCHWWKK